MPPTETSKSTVYSVITGSESTVFSGMCMILLYGVPLHIGKCVIWYLERKGKGKTFSLIFPLNLLPQSLSTQN